MKYKGKSSPKLTKQPRIFSTNLYIFSISLTWDRCKILSLRPSDCVTSFWQCTIISLNFRRDTEMWHNLRWLRTTIIPTSVQSSQPLSAPCYKFYLPVHEAGSQRDNISPGFKKGLEAKMDSSVKRVLKIMRQQKSIINASLSNGISYLNRTAIGVLLFITLFPSPFSLFIFQLYPVWYSTSFEVMLCQGQP